MSVHEAKPAEADDDADQGEGGTLKMVKVASAMRPKIVAGIIGPMLAAGGAAPDVMVLLGHINASVIASLYDDDQDGRLTSILRKQTLDYLKMIRLMMREPAGRA
jgi:hypothetical protein